MSAHHKGGESTSPTRDDSDRDRPAFKSADSVIKHSVASFDPLAGYTHPKEAFGRPREAEQAEQPQRADASRSAVDSNLQDRMEQTSVKDGRHSPTMRRSASGDVPRTGGARVPRRESWHAGQTSSPSPIDEEEEPPVGGRAPSNTTRLRRRSTSARTGYKATALQPPKLPELRESDDEFRAHVDLEKTSSWHHLPLFLVAVPSLGAILHGRAENWSDAIILALVVFYLYHLIKVPWELYYASYARSVLPSALSAEGAAEAEAQDDPTLRAIRLTSAAQLKRAELFSLSLTFLVPAIGAALLYFARGLLSDPDRYINRFLIGLFAIASSVKPISHAVRLLEQNSLYHQEIVHYPSSEVAMLKKKLAQLETTASLRPAGAPAAPTDSPAPSIPTAVSPEQLDSLSRSFRRHTLAAAQLQTTTSARLDDLSSTMAQLVEVIEAQESEIVRLQQQQRLEGEAVERAVASTGQVSHRRQQRRNPLADGGLVKGVVRHLLLYLAYPPRQRRRHGRRRSMIGKVVSAAAFVPVTVPKKAVEWAVEKSAKGAVHLLGWEGDEYAEQDDSDSEADDDDLDRQRNGRKTRKRLPAPPSQVATGSKPLLPGSFDSEARPKSVSHGREEQRYPSTPVDDRFSNTAHTRYEDSADRSRAAASIPATSPSSRAIPVRTGGVPHAFPVTGRRNGARLVSAH